MDVIIRTVSKAIFPFILLLGVFIIFHGHLTPGGSFPGAAITISGIALIIISYSLKKAERIINEENAHKIEAIVALILALIVIYEPVFRNYIKYGTRLFELWSAQQILFLNLLGGAMAATALLLIIFLMVKE
ncbi:MAG: hypothetical protein J7K72_04965 [Candidatus Aenigmarchaeota archaeon]|nr:hypothetical protein [Candidatus Aenigmarchaeota archaeon]